MHMHRHWQNRHACLKMLEVISKEPLTSSQGSAASAMDSIGGPHFPAHSPMPRSWKSAKLWPQPQIAIPECLNCWTSLFREPLHLLPEDWCAAIALWELPPHDPWSNVLKRSRTLVQASALGSTQPQKGISEIF